MIYRITHTATGGTAQVHYNANGIVHSVMMDGVVVPYLCERWTSIAQEANLPNLVDDGFTFKLTRGQGTHEKIALWCRLYKELKGTAWKVSKKEAGQLAHIDVEEAFLRYYLDDAKLPENSTTWLWRGKQSIQNLVNQYNLVRTQYEAPRAAPKPKSAFPDVYNREYEKRLDGLGVTAYRKHLAGLGLVAKVDRMGAIIDYVPKT